MIKVGDIIERDGISYKVGLADEVGPNTRRQGIIQSLGLTRVKGKALFMAWVFEDGTVGRIDRVGGKIA